LRDITAPEYVSVRLSYDRKRLWVNVDGECVLRCCRIKNLSVEDLSAIRPCNKCGKLFEVVIPWQRVTTCPACDPNPVLSTNANHKT